VGEWLSNQVWLDFAPAQSLPDDDLPFVYLHDEIGDVSDATAYPTATSGVVGLLLGPTHLDVDLYSGEIVQGEFGYAPSPGWQATHPALPVGLEFHTSLAEGWPDGPAAALGTVDLAYLGDSKRRTYYSDGSEWRLIDGACGPASGDVFEADDLVWVLWNDADGVRWRPLGNVGASGKDQGGGPTNEDAGYAELSRT
jgi:hypothetical protein